MNPAHLNTDLGLGCGETPALCRCGHPEDCHQDGAPGHDGGCFATVKIPVDGVGITHVFSLCDCDRFEPAPASVPVPDPCQSCNAPATVEFGGWFYCWDCWRNRVHFVGLNGDECEVVHESARYQVEGLLQGRSEHGPLHLDGDQRDFSAEAGMELRDGNTYLSALRVLARRRNTGAQGRVRARELALKEERDNG